MIVRQQWDILEHAYRLFTDFNHGISPGVGYVTYRITPYPDNVKCHREVFSWWETSIEGTEFLPVMEGYRVWSSFRKFT